jgi:DNA-directed RNA polymerase subunit L
MATMEQPVVVAKSPEANHIFRFQLKDVPVQLVNAIRRIHLSETPTVEVQDVVILQNTTAMPHEMLRHRIEMLPINVRPTEDETILKAKIELRVGPVTEETKIVTTDDFKVDSARPDILMKDRDLGTPLFVMRMKRGEVLHIQARLGINPLSSQVCTTTYAFHVDPVRAEEDKAKYIAEHPEIPDAEQVFNNAYIQRSYSRDPETGRPNWFDVSVETLGVIPARELTLSAVKSLKDRVKQWADTVKDTVVRHKEEGVYTFVSAEGHTLGALLQYILYSAPEMVRVVDYDVPHPLRQEMRLRVLTDKRPEEIIAFCLQKVTDYCTRIEAEL